ncbi:MAG: indole-3-glycerol phosphate synthase TrpC [Candidatus Melainabacteria bacterium]|nr:indole-3-glycerol phosphate synthase TrpC [Candidatus Melainabacteria bacterium]
MNILEEIIAYKKIEIEKSKERLSLDRLKKNMPGRDAINCVSTALKTKINKKQIALIAEIKKASPSKGIIKKNFNHIEIAKAYKNGGACCLSVLTDEKYFQGNLNYIHEIKNVVDLPVLQKDFIIDPYQIYESIYYGADCVLLIAETCRGMSLQLRDLYEIACENEIDCLIEIHNEREMEIALNINPQMIGINNRDLKTFETNLNTTKNLITKYKKDLKDKIVVSESGIFTNEDIKSLVEHGVYSFLVGESLIKQEDIESATKELINL